MEYDALNRVVRSTGPDGGVTVWHYNESDRPQNRAQIGTGNPTVRVVDPAGVERWASFDALGRMVEIAHPAAHGPGTVLPTCAGDTQYRYDANGNILQITLRAEGAGEQYRLFRYDGLGRLDRLYLPEAGSGIREDGGITWSVALTYDERSNLVRRQDSRNLVTIYDYGADPFNRLQRITYDTSGYTRYPNRPNIIDKFTACPDIVYTYEQAGDVPADQQRKPRLECAPKPLATIRWNGLVSVSTTMQSAPTHPLTVEYGHDALGRRTSVTYPDRYESGNFSRTTVTNELALGGRPSAVSTSSDYGLIATDIAYTAAGLPTSITFGEGVVETYRYDHPTRGCSRSKASR